MQSSEIARRRLEASELESRSLKESLAAKVPLHFPPQILIFYSQILYIFITFGSSYKFAYIEFTFAYIKYEYV